MREMRVTATKEGMQTVLRELESGLKKAHCPDKEKMECLIALEELIVNIVHYAYKQEDSAPKSEEIRERKEHLCKQEEGEMQISYEIVRQTEEMQMKEAVQIQKETAEKETVDKITTDRVDKKIKVILKDQGKPYNPLKREDPDITLKANRRKVGGLGIFMAKNLLDEISYERKENSNILYLEKDFTSF